MIVVNDVLKSWSGKSSETLVLSKSGVSSVTAITGTCVAGPRNKAAAGLPPDDKPAEPLLAYKKKITKQLNIIKCCTLDQLMYITLKIKYEIMKETKK